MEGVRVLQSQLCPVKINNVRTDAILQLNGIIKKNALAVLNNNNNMQLIKLS